MLRPLPKQFYSRSALKVAPDLLGKILCHRTQGKFLSGRIVEVEAYLGEQDPASHAFRGKTPRNTVMFGPPGFAYVYFTYGNHFCMNAVTGRDGKAGAVLIRALEPVKGIDTMKRRRKKCKVSDLTSGPGKLTQALGIGKKCNQADLASKTLWIAQDTVKRTLRWERTPRIGISVAKRKRYRFVVKGSLCVSKMRSVKKK